MFQRKFESDENLKKELLFNDCLLPDINRGNVFPAIRNGYMCFYYEGQLLFRYDGEFKTHIKFATTPGDATENYVSEKSFLGNGQALLKSFKEDYNKIKTNCKLYSKGSEAAGLSSLYKYSFARSKENIVVLDIEISFESQGESKNQDRVDVLLYNKKTKKLKFVEAKLYSNKEIRSKTTPRVVSQIKKYNRQIDSKQHADILPGYKKYICCMNDLFGIKIACPTGVLQRTGLYIFGFDAYQKKWDLDKKIVPQLKDNGITPYAIGNPRNVDITTLWNEVTKT
ncbi:MAG: hypothetical protein KKH94_12910 [Candidatus Omnitrophica bacterium]|nr:hypothetical protein [Candidatus Omnitrophota bacterium]